MSAVREAVTGVTRRLPARTKDRHEGYAFCTEDRFWFRPAYTEGKCPLCGKVAPGGAPPAPRLRRMDRSWFGLAGLAVESAFMLTLVLVMWFR